MKASTGEEYSVRVIELPNEKFATIPVGKNASRLFKEQLKTQSVEGVYLSPEDRCEMNVKFLYEAIQELREKQEKEDLPADATCRFSYVTPKSRIEEMVVPATFLGDLLLASKTTDDQTPRWKQLLKKSPNKLLTLLAKINLGYAFHTACKEKLTEPLQKSLPIRVVSEKPDLPPERPEKRWLKVTLHSHTKESDGKLSIEESIDVHAKAGVGILAITDHVVPENTALGQVAIKLGKCMKFSQLLEYFKKVEAAKKYAWEKYGMILIAGLEPMNTLLQGVGNTIQSLPLNPHHTQIDSQAFCQAKSSHDLACIVANWHKLSDPLKAAILSIVQSVDRGQGL